MARPGLARRNRRTALLFLIPGALYFALVFLYPIVRTVQMSLHQVDIASFVSGDWQFSGLANFRALLHLQATSRTLVNSALFLVGSIISQFTVAILLAVALRRQTKVTSALRTLVLTPWLLPSVTVAAVFLWIFNARGGLANFLLQKVGLIQAPIEWFAGGSALAVIIVVNIWIGIPFNFLILQSGLQAVDESVHEAAVMDGAGWWRELTGVTLPIMKESVFMVLMLGVIGTLKVFDYVWIMTKGGPANATMLPGPLAYSEAFVIFDYGRAAAIVMVVVLAMLIMSAGYVLLNSRAERRDTRQLRRRERRQQAEGRQTVSATPSRSASMTRESVR